MSNLKDTNQVELCKEVYEKTGWIVGDESWDWHTTIDAKLDSMFIAPKYYTDYLLEKLPPVVQDSYDKKFRHIQMWINGDGEAIACYVEPYDKYFRGAYIAESDSMLKALLKLTIALSEAG